MKTQSELTLEFQLHHIVQAVENLRYSLIYCSHNSENSQHYFDKLNDAIQEYHNKYLQNDFRQLETGE